MTTATLYYGNIYIYLDDMNNHQIGIYMSDTNIAKRVCIIPMREDLSSGYMEIKGMNKVAYPLESIEINKNKIVEVLRIKGSIAKVSYEEFVILSNYLINKLTNKILDTYGVLTTKRLQNPNKKDYALTEDHYKYLTWFEHKSNLEFATSIKRNPKILKYGLYYAEIGENIGSELHKLRPVVIFKRFKAAKPDDTSYMVIPVTSKSTSGKYPFNTPILVNGKINYIRTNDLRRISVKRLVSPLYKSGTNKICVLSDEERDLLLENFRDYFLKDVKK